MRHAGIHESPHAHPGPGIRAWPPEQRLASDGVSPIRRMATGLHRLFNDVGLGSTGWDDIDLQRTEPIMPDAWDPDVAVYRKGDTVVIRADLLGVDKDHVRVDVGSDALTISGEWAVQQAEDAPDHHRSERNHGTFYRSIPLVEGADAEHCEASFKDGVLEVQFQVPHDVEPKRTSIAIK